MEGHVTREGAPVSTGYARLLGSGDEFVEEVPLGDDGGFRFFAAPGSWTLRVLAPGGLRAEQPVQADHGKVTMPWSKAAEEDGTFKSDDALRALYGDEAGVDFGKDTIAYCRIGERSAHTWFVLHELLGQPNVKNYDGSWTEYGSLVGVPIELGEAR